MVIGWMLLIAMNATKNSWEIIKESVRRKDSVTGTTGELVDVNKASKVYMALRHNLRDQKQSDDAFNDDPLVTKELMSRNLLESIGMV